MQFRRYFSFLLTLVFLHFGMVVKAQSGLCPSNLDFESGTLANWDCQAGTVDGAGNLMLNPTGPIAGRHTIIPAATAGIDPYGGFSQICPNGSGFSVKLGNATGGHEAESMSYTYAIPNTVSTFSMIFNYAVVFNDPSHLAFEQPRFRARITDLSTNLPIPCVDFDFVASASLPGFSQSPIASDVFYKDWTPITINLTPFIGKTIKLEFITNDCVYSAHFGYAYVDVNTACNGAISGTTICQGENEITLSAPYGFATYQWFEDNTFANVLSTTQTLHLDPAPTVGSIFPVIVNPFPGFGCKDTLYAIISVAPKPISFAGVDQRVCENQSAQLGAPGSPGLTYQWNPAAQVSNPIIANPLGWNNPPPVDGFILKTTDILTGCFSYDTVVLETKVVDVAVAVDGVTEFCDGVTTGAVLSVNNNSSPVRWFETATPIAGATNISHKPLSTGNYWAEITQDGCKDSTAITTVTVYPLPKALFTVDSDTACITSNSFLFTNNTAPANPGSLWKFSDGSTLTTPDAVKAFASVGTYITELVTTTAFGCKDSTNMKVYVMPNAIPDFTWDSICVDRPLLFHNLGDENNSPLVKYNWDFNNGGAGSTLKDPWPVIYSTPGRIDVTMSMTALGCENDVQSIVKNVQANKQAAGIRYKGITTAQGFSNPIHVRDTIGNIYRWRPQSQLSSYTTRYTEYFATNDDIDYRIDITDGHTCVTTDSIFMQILRKPGYYLPSAFTPNGDGLNDIVKPYLVNMKELKSFTIYNRWGNMVFHTTKEGVGWDGKFNGRDEASGVYVWMLEFIDKNDKKMNEKGTITIIR